jgi:hypothetical protein
VTDSNPTVDADGDEVVDRSPYPMTALLEATIRFVMNDLKEHP